MKKKCEYCKREFDTDGAECPGCGAPLTAVPENQSKDITAGRDIKLSKYASKPQEETAKTKPKLVAIIIVIVSLLILGGILFPCIVNSILYIIGNYILTNR
ncbi:MAG TPA: hypothetical protein ENN73_00305 [Firmicutes bacterium]|nr:hypothetical protein [Bacillota bacterium]